MPREPKTRVTVDAPPPFAEFMRHVDHLISTGDDAAKIESDDLFQCDCAYGGLFDAKGEKYGFRYFHDDNANWDIHLCASDIHRIAKGELTTLELWQCTSGNCTRLFPIESCYCRKCDSILHFDNYESRLRAQRPDAPESLIGVMTNLRRIGLGILGYHREHGKFPPAVLKDQNGAPLHSWRSLILPHIDRIELFDAISFDQPWDSPANRAIAEELPDDYRSNDCDAPQTRFVGIVNSSTIWPPSGDRAQSDITSGSSYTIAAIHSRATSTHWMAPNDTDIATMLSEYESHNAILAVFVDAHVNSIQDVGVERLRELACI